MSVIAQAIADRQGEIDHLQVAAILRTAVPKYLDVNPAAGVQTPRRRNFEARILTRDEEAALPARATLEERALVLCALDTLQRLSDVVGLQRAQDPRNAVSPYKR